MHDALYMELCNMYVLLCQLKIKCALCIIHGIVQYVLLYQFKIFCALCIIYGFVHMYYYVSLRLFAHYALYMKESVFISI